jgi:hypothetical protein
VKTGSQTLVSRGEGGERVLPSSRELARGNALVLGPLFRVLTLVIGSNFVPGSVGISSALAKRVGKLGIGLLGNLELTIRPLESLTGSSSLSSTERGTVDIMGISLVRGSISNQSRDLDKRRLICDRLGSCDGIFHAVKVVVSILDMLDVPSHSLITSADIFSERDLGVSINGDSVVIIKGNELAESPMASERCGLRGNTLHVATITHDNVGVVVDEIHTGLIETGSQVFLSKGKTNTVGNSLAEGAGGNLNTLGKEILGVTGGLGSPLTELLEVLNAHVIAEQVEERVLEHGAVTSREDKAVAVGPFGVLGVCSDELLEENIRHGSASHGKTGMARVSLQREIRE